MFLFLGEKQMLINLTFFTGKFPEETETDTSLRQRAGLFPKVDDRDWCAPDSLWCGEDMTEKALFWNTFDFTINSTTHSSTHLSCFQCPLSACVLVRCKDPIQGPLETSSTEGLGKGRLPHCCCEKSCLCLQTATVWLSHGCPKLMIPSSSVTEEDEGMQSLTDWQLMDLWLTTRVVSFISISSFIMITHQGNLVRSSALQNN